MVGTKNTPGGNLSQLHSKVYGSEIPDDNSRDARDRHYQISLDGNAVIEGAISYGDKPVHVNVDVTGAHSLRVTIGGQMRFGDPTLSKGTLQSFRVANLISPADGTTAKGNSVNLLWEPVDGAASYGVEIVCTKGGSPRIYALNVTGGDSNAKFDLTNVPNGEYHWSVIAFDSKGVMGKFSKDRTFIVAK